MSKSFKFNIIIYTTFYLLINHHKCISMKKKYIITDKNTLLRTKIHYYERKYIITNANTLLRTKIHYYGNVF